MTNSFKNSPKYMLTSESVTEGHPDKLCDQISDAVLDAILKDDPYGRVACETAVTTGLVIVLGEITTTCYVDIPQIVRGVVRDVGYTYPEYGFDYQSCGILDGIKEQSADIDIGVSQSLEVKKGLGGDELDNAEMLYLQGVREMNPNKKYYPDANSTLRFTYGKVMDYYPRDAVHFDYITKLSGVMEKEDPEFCSVEGSSKDVKRGGLPLLGLDGRRGFLTSRFF